MNLIEALKALEEGEKIRRKTWVAIAYVQLDQNGKIVNNLGQKTFFLLTSNDVRTACWEVIEEPVLRAAVRLFGRRVGYVRKIKEYTLEELGL